MKTNVKRQAACISCCSPERLTFTNSLKDSGNVFLQAGTCTAAWQMTKKWSNYPTVCFGRTAALHSKSPLKPETLKCESSLTGEHWCECLRVVFHWGKILANTQVGNSFSFCNMWKYVRTSRIWLVSVGLGENICGGEKFLTKPSCVVFTCEIPLKPQKCGADPKRHKWICGHATQKPCGPNCALFSFI